MRVLYITQGFPEPRVLGGQIASYYNIEQLTRAGHVVTAVCLVPRGATPTSASSLRGIASVVVVKDVPPTSIWRMLLNSFDPLPWPIRRYASKGLHRTLTDLVTRDHWDLVFFNSLHSATALKTVRGLTEAPCVLMEHNVQSTIMELFARSQRRILHRLFAMMQSRKMHAFEKNVIAGFDLVLTYTDVDRDILSSMSPGTPVTDVPLCLDSSALGARDTKERHDVLLLGYLGWMPNQDSLRWFLDDIAPRIRRARPDTGLEIVGAGAPDWVAEAAARSGATFHGGVPDVGPWFGGARVIAVPLRIGSGVRVKIIEAMMMGKAVVSTSKGCEGLAVKDGEHLLIADSPDEFAECVTRLLDSPDERRRLGESGRRLAAEIHDAHAPDRPIVQACESLARSRSVRSHR